MSPRIAFALVALVALSACEDKKTETGGAASASAAVSVAASASASATPSASASAAPTATAAVDPNAVPSHTDEAQKAAREIDKANYKSELDKLDKEIGK